MSTSRASFPSPKPPDLLARGPVSFAAVVAGASSVPSIKPRFDPLLIPARTGSKEGRPAICFSQMEIGECEKRFAFFVVAKFTMGRPSLGEIQAAFQRAWSTTGRVTISEVWDNRHLFIIFESEDDVCGALASPLCKVGNATFRLFRWTADYNYRKESAISTVWVRLPGLPISIYDSAFIKEIVSSFGYFVGVDAKTKACTALNWARACVELDVTKEIRDAIWISLADNKGYWQKIEVESKIAYCGKCKIHGHTLGVCRKRKNVLIPEEDQGVSAEGSIPEKVNIGVKLRRSNGGQEWREVVSKKNKSSLSGYLRRDKEQTITAVVNNVESMTVDQLTIPSEEEQNKALVIFQKPGVIPKRNNMVVRGEVDRQPKIKLKNTFLNVFPKDLSGVELKIRKKSDNVLVFNEQLGVFSHPDVAPHYQRIRDLA